MMKKCICLSILFSAISIHFFAIEPSETHDAPLITDIKYDYTIVDSERFGKDCVGTLSFQLGPQQDVDYYIVYRDGNNSRWTYSHGFMLLHSWCDIEDEGSTHFFTRNEIYWDIFFQISVTYKDGIRISSKKYNTNDFISEEDLNYLKRFSGTAYISKETEPYLECIGNMLIINSPEPYFFVISDLLGQRIYNGLIEKELQIDLSKSSSNLIIVKYYNNTGNTTIKKFIIS